MTVLLDFSLTVKAATLILISGCGLAISSAKEGKSGLAVSIVLSFLCGYIKVQSDDFIHSVVILLWMLSAVR